MLVVLHCCCFGGASAVRSDTAEDELMRALHEEHATALWGYVAYVTRGDRQRAEDIVQETLLRAWRHPRVLRRPAGQVRAWLFTVARNVAIDGWRAASARSEIATEVLPDRSAVDETERALQGWMVAEAMGELTARHREVLALCYFEGFSVAEAAVRLGIAEGTVKSRSHYALRALRLALREKGVSWP